jgi:hypothetical protein
VPASRVGHAGAGGPFSAAQLKAISEFFSLVTFAAFSSAVLKEPLRWVDLGAFALICGGVALSLLTKPAAVKPAGAELAAPESTSGERRLSDAAAALALADAAGVKAPAEAAPGAATPAIEAMESAAEGEGAGGGAVRRRSSRHQGAGGDRE